MAVTDRSKSNNCQRIDNVTEHGQNQNRGNDQIYGNMPKGTKKGWREMVGILLGVETETGEL